MRHIVLLVSALALPMAAGAQTTQFQLGAQPALEVQRLAPQLVTFAGGDVNFNNLVNGLALGLPVTLSSTTAPGVTQVVTFTPSGTMSVTQIAQLLETARQSLIARGIPAPTPEQLGAVLTGGTLSTALGATPVNGLVSTTSGLTTNTAGNVSPAAALQNANSAAVAGGTTLRNMSDSRFPRGISDTPPTPVPGLNATPAANTPAAASVPGAATTTPTATAPAGAAANPTAPARTR
jgi:hypothetical protein